MARDDADKLRILLSHWVEHNEDHAGEFTEWAARARAGGWGPVHDHMMKAVEQMKAANQSLLAALESLKEG